MPNELNTVSYGNPLDFLGFRLEWRDGTRYADLGCQGSNQAVTPQIDSLAANGVRCTAGYVTAPQCCPSRAGLITGRYQNRFGFEANWPSSLSGTAGLPTSEPPSRIISRPRVTSRA